MRTWARMLPRAAILATAIGAFVVGDPFYGAFCFVALALTMAPSIHARTLDAGIPIELELVLLWLMLADMTFGNLLGLYVRVPWFDKVLHLGNSVLIGAIGFLAVYVLHLTGRTRFHPWLAGVAILLVTLGVGALWEIGEYAVDKLFGRASQGSPGMSVLDDTMIDLILDGLGGVIGAILGSVYIRYSKRTLARRLR